MHKIQVDRLITRQYIIYSGNWMRKIKLPTPNLCHKNQTILPAGIFLYPDRFHSMHILVWEHYWPATEFNSSKDSHPDISTTLPPPTKFHLPHLFQMFSTNSVSHSIQKSHCSRAIYQILDLPIHLMVIFKLNF